MLRKLFKRESKKIEDGLSKMGLEFNSLEDAEKHFNLEVENQITKLISFSETNPSFEYNFKAESLKQIETLYFKFFVDKNGDFDYTEMEFKKLIDIYTCLVFIENKMAEWEVQENHFQEGRYQLGIMLGDGTWTNAVFSNRIDKKKLKSKTSIYDYFIDYVPDHLVDEI